MQKSTSYYDHSRDEMLDFINTVPRKILEIGCGTGKFSLTAAVEVAER